MEEHNKVNSDQIAQQHNDGELEIDHFVEDEDIAAVEELDGQDPTQEDEAMEVDPSMSMEDGEHAGEFAFEDDSIQGFFEHKEPVFSVALSPIHPNIVVTGGGDDRAFLWDLSNGEAIHQVSGHTDSIISTGFSSDGKYVATGGMDGLILVTAVDTCELVATLEGPDEVVWTQWHPKGPVLLAGASDSSIWMYQLPSGRVMNVFSGHSDSVTCGSFTPDGKKIVTGSEDASLIVWDPVNATALNKITGADARFHQVAITSLAVSHDNSLLLSGGLDGSVKLIRIASGEILRSFEAHTDSVEAIGFCKSMPLAATASVDGSICIWDMATMKLRHTCKHEDSVIQIIWHPELPQIFSSSVDHTICQWDARTGECLKRWQGHQDSVLSIALSSDAQIIVSGSDDGNALVFRV